MKKILMLCVKWFVGIIPKSLKESLKKHPALLALYSKSLQKSGLFFGFPTPLQLSKLYKSNIAVQEHFLSSAVDNDLNANLNANLNAIFILVRNCSKEVSVTLQNLSKIMVNEKVFLVGNKEYCNSLDLTPLHSKVSWCDLSLIEFKKFDNYFVINAGDQIHEKYLLAFESLLKNTPSDIVYCDTDYIDVANNRQQPEFYPSWNPELLLSTGYINTGVLFTSKLQAKSFLDYVSSDVEQFSIAKWLTNNYLQGNTPKISHLPMVLVHKCRVDKLNWHSSLSSILPQQIGSQSLRSGRLASLKWPIIEKPLVSLIIPTKDSFELVKSCIDSILTKTNYKNYEIILVDNNSSEQQSLNYFKLLELNPKITVLKYPKPFNYSAINNFAVRHSKGTVVGLINNDVEVITSDWLDYMVGHVVRTDIGCVGAKLLYPDGRIQHAGVVMGYGGGAGHAHKYFPRYHDGYLYRLNASSNYSAVTAACLIVEKADYFAVGGLNEKHLTVAFNDVDFCLKVLGLGKRNLYCAEAELFHHESISRGLEDTLEKQTRFKSELNYLKATWQNYIADDPAYNQNLTLLRENFSIKQHKEHISLLRPDNLRMPQY